MRWIKDKLTAFRNSFAWALIKTCLMILVIVGILYAIKS
jgi:hypothetical protein